MLARGVDVVLQFGMPPSAMLGERPVTAPGDSVSSSSVPAGMLPPVQMAEFEGPLDLLLHLVRAGRMDIFDLPIRTLCDQYVTYLTSMEALDLNVAGEFLVMAATLLEIKSRLLLPAPPKDPDDDDANEGSEPIDPRVELVKRLLEYGKYQEIAETLRQAEADRKLVFFRSPTEYSGKFAVPPRFGEMSADALLRALQRIMLDADTGERSITSVRRQKITLKMKMRSLLGEAERAAGDGANLDDLIPEPPFALIEIVLIFLALLELMRVGSVRVAQDVFCGQIRVFFVPLADRAADVNGDVLIGESTE